MGQVIDLDRETSGISTAVREAVAFSVYDAEASPIVNQRLNAIARVKSCAFVPVIAAERVDRRRVRGRPEASASSARRSWR